MWFYSKHFKVNNCLLIGTCELRKAECKLRSKSNGDHAEYKYMNTRLNQMNKIVWHISEKHLKFCKTEERWKMKTGIVFQIKGFPVRNSSSHF